MSTKRLIGTVVVKNQLAVQSFGFNKYLPLGDPIILIENLERWGIDEILVLNIDRSTKNKGPDFDFLNKLTKMKFKTPLIYAGGINSKEHGLNVIRTGIERIVVDTWITKKLEDIIELSNMVGRQCIIPSLPLSVVKNQLVHYNYITQNSKIFHEKLKLYLKEISAEILLIDYLNEGNLNGFSEEIITKFLPLQNLSIIAFGGITPSQSSNLLRRKEISAVAIGNYLNYKEHCVQHLKQSFKKINIRPEQFNSKI